MRRTRAGPRGAGGSPPSGGLAVRRPRRGRHGRGHRRRGGAPAAAGAAPVATATVVRTNLVTTVLTEGTLGYAATRPVVNQLTGTYTWLPRPGGDIAAGGVLYRVDNLPVVLMTGRMPAWRPFGSGMTDGPDVTELRAQPDRPAATPAACSPAPAGRFDRGHRGRRGALAARPPGYRSPGRSRSGQVVFLPGPVRVGAPDRRRRASRPRRGRRPTR